jgi:hypothetical protein
MTPYTTYSTPALIADQKALGREFMPPCPAVRDEAAMRAIALEMIAAEAKKAVKTEGSFY